ncbi:MAG TPA: citrate synthase [Xanthobacteraceae bacterium]|jgi:citrate synthase|nr:citrate synthase [Xanthobacteraceae bacterium]
MGMSSKGLEGVVAAQTALSHVYGEEGRLVYAGYEIEDLAENASFEEVCHLLWFGDLPNSKQLEDLRQRIAESAAVDQSIIEICRMADQHDHPMATLRTAISALSFFDDDAEDNSEQANLRKAIRLTGQAVTITAAIERVRRGEQPVAPRADLRLAENFLYMLRRKAPDELEARIVDVALTLHAEHGMNASTFAARVTAGTLADMHSAITAAIGALKGPLHGGANEQVMTMLQEIGTPANAEQWVRDALGRGEKIMGFGHRVYRTLDPRAPILKRLAEELNARAGGHSQWLEIAEIIQRVVREEMDRRGKKIYPNVDFFSASVYYTLGIPKDLFTNIFACARMAGWTAHIMEQHKDNRLIRPQSEYTGPHGKRVQPIAQR